MKSIKPADHFLVVIAAVADVLDVVVLAAARHLT